ncbi:MAG: class I SAM-dependent methyltransferase [Candidatus Nitrotoga sp.]
MTEPRGQELINRYRWNYGIAKDAELTEKMILAHWTLEQRLTRELLESTPENRWETFERCYTTLYGELEWLNRLTGGTDTTSPAERYQHWADLIGSSPKSVYEVGSGKAAMIGHLAQLGHQCTATEITRERGAKHVVEHLNLRWTQSDGIHLERFEQPGIYDFVLSDNVIEHMHPDDLIHHFEGACKILKPGGQYLMAVPHRWFGPCDISKVFKYEVASGMHLKEYTYRELRHALLYSGFREVAAVRMPPPHSTEPARADTRWMRRICLMEALFSPFARPILRGRVEGMAERAGIASLIFLAATK